MSTHENFLTYRSDPTKYSPADRAEALVFAFFASLLANNLLYVDWLENNDEKRSVCMESMRDTFIPQMYSNGPIIAGDLFINGLLVLEERADVLSPDWRTCYGKRRIVMLQKLHNDMKKAVEEVHVSKAAA